MSLFPRVHGCPSGADVGQELGGKGGLHAIPANMFLRRSGLSLVPVPQLGVGLLDSPRVT